MVLRRIAIFLSMAPLTCVWMAGVSLCMAWSLESMVFAFSYSVSLRRVLFVMDGVEEI